VLLVLAGAGVAVAAYIYWPTDLPPVKALEEYTPSIGSRVYAGDDEFITEFQAEKRIFVPLQQIPPTLRNAIIAVEDSRFYSHFGVDVRGIGRAAYANFRHGRVVEGGSTITQQLAKNLYLSPARNPIRKLRELLITRKLEASLTKRRILELYLNVIEWGDGVYGAEAAARTYFGTSAAGLSAEQSALLAGAIINPRVHNPAHPTPRLRRRQQIILRRMGWVTPPAESPATPEVSPPETTTPDVPATPDGRPTDAQPLPEPVDIPEKLPDIAPPGPPPAPPPQP
jgi:monofunctional biosynthetic peptidoglycan transglycosylase